MDIKVRRATHADIKDIKIILSFYYLETEELEERFPEFIVAEIDNKVAGCACLDTGNIVELRSIAVLPGDRNKGIGSILVDSLLGCASLLTDTVYVRTASPLFFEKKGFIRLENKEKKAIREDCRACDKFDFCKQLLMKIKI